MKEAWQEEKREDRQLTSYFPVPSSQLRIGRPCPTFFRVRKIANATREARRGEKLVRDQITTKRVLPMQIDRKIAT